VAALLVRAVARKRRRFMGLKSGLVVVTKSKCVEFRLY
jgi:hypothetical protein